MTKARNIFEVFEALPGDQFVVLNNYEIDLLARFLLSINEKAVAEPKQAEEEPENQSNSAIIPPFSA